MSVQITATLDQPTLLGLLRELTPLTLQLGDGDHDGRWMVIQPPDSVVFVGGEGVRAHTSATVQWTVASVPIGFTLQSVTVLLKPSAIDGRLSILPVILDADFKNVPALVDRAIVGIANTRLAAMAGTIGWGFARTLEVRLPMPAAFSQVEGFALDSGVTVLEMREDALWISMGLEMHFPRRPSPLAATAASAPERPAEDMIEAPGNPAGVASGPAIVPEVGP